ncbi:DUF4192 domain-containing protein [Streptomyces pactum]|uniref:DUF4192 domain-containing protein n=1 Tax=Streptomyces pactum TaxID=68249 RepID=UPI0036F80660
MTHHEANAFTHHASAGPSGEEQVTLRGPADLADALPFLLGFHPDDSIVLVALHGPQGRFGGRLRMGIPQAAEDWPEAGDQLAESLATGSERRGERPDGVVLFLCQDPAAGASGRDVMERLRPLAQRLRVACGRLDMPVFEALCISDGRFWSYCCPDPRCCPPDGTPLGVPGTSVMAAAAAYAGIQVRGTLRQLEARLAPLGETRAPGQEGALDRAASVLVPRVLGGGSAAVREETLTLLSALMDRLRAEPPIADPLAADARDDGLLTADEAATVIMGLQDRVTRDRAAEWMEGPEAGPALRLWRALARRCAGAYAGYAAAPLTLAGWVAWSTGDEPSARVALGRALRADPDYLFAKLLHQACNDGMDPEQLRRCLRRERADQAVHGAVHAELARTEPPAVQPSRTPGTGTPGTPPPHTGAAGAGAGAAPLCPRPGGTTAAEPATGEPAARSAGDEDSALRPAGDEAASPAAAPDGPAAPPVRPADRRGPRRCRPGPAGPGAPRGGRDGRRPAPRARERGRPGRREWR